MNEKNKQIKRRAIFAELASRNAMQVGIMEQSWATIHLFSVGENFCTVIEKDDDTIVLTQTPNSITATLKAIRDL